MIAAPIADVSAEAIVAACEMIHGDTAEGITAAHFTDPLAADVFTTCADLRAAGKTVGEDSVAAALVGRRTENEVGTLAEAALKFAYFKDSIAKLVEMHRRRQIRAAGQRMVETAEAGEGYEDAVATITATRPSTVSIADLDAYRFNEADPPPPPRPIYTLDGKVIATPGNLGAVISLAKVGKSAVTGAMIGATTGEGDTLGIGSTNEEGGAVVHFDTEQSPCDHHAVVATALRRTGAACPLWLRSYSVVRIPVPKRLDLFAAELERARKAHGSVHSAIVDGIADFVQDPNDPAEAFAAVERLHQLAADFDTTIFSVLHINPGSETGKTRGHLGSQLERKAETTLRLDKDTDGITTIWCERGRHCHIPKADGHRFQWDTAAGMHTSVGSARAEKAVEQINRLREIALGAFSDSAGMKYGEACAAVQTTANCSLRSAEKHIRDMKTSRLIVAVGGGRWGLAGYTISPQAA